MKNLSLSCVGGHAKHVAGTVVFVVALGGCTSSSDRPPNQAASAGGAGASSGGGAALNGGAGATFGGGAAATGGDQGVGGAGSIDSYTLNLGSVTERQQMQDWDPAWISEYEEEFGGYEWQVDPANGGQIGVWTGSGNPSTSPAQNRDYSQFIAAGPTAGMPTRVRMRFEHQDEGTWVSCAHTSDDATRSHYEVALQGSELCIYKFWGPSPFNDYEKVAATSFNAVDGTVYWLHLTERRAGNDAGGAVTIEGALLDQQQQPLATIEVTDTGSLAGQPLIPSSNKRGFGSFSQADGNGPHIFEWIVEPAP